MLVIDMAIDQIEDVTEEDRRKGHGTPILTEASYAEGLNDECWVNAKQEAVS